MNKRFEKAIQAAVLAGSIAASAGLVASCDLSAASTSKSSSSSSSDGVLAVDGGTQLEATETPFTLTGTKPKGTSVWVNNVKVVDRSNETTWSADVDLDTGDNLLTVLSRDRRGDQDGVLAISVFYTPAPTVDGVTTITVDSLPLTITGTKAAGADVRLNGDVVVEQDDDTAYSFDIVSGQIDFVEGDNVVALTSELDGHTSAEVELTLSIADATGPTFVKAWISEPFCDSLFVQFSEPVVWNGGNPEDHFTIRGNRHTSFTGSFYSGSAQATVPLSSSDSYAGGTIASLNSVFPPIVSGSVVEFDLSYAYITLATSYSGNIRVSYSKGDDGIRDAIGNLAESFSILSTGEGFGDFLNSAESGPGSFCSNY